MANFRETVNMRNRLSLMEQEVEQQHQDLRQLLASVLMQLNKVPVIEQMERANKRHFNMDDDEATPNKVVCHKDLRTGMSTLVDTVESKTQEILQLIALNATVEQIWEQLDMLKTIKNTKKIESQTCDMNVE